MAGGTKGATVPNGIHDENKPIELAFELPHSTGLRIHLHLTVKATSIVLFLTNTSADSAQAAASMGSFVYAMPDRYQPHQPLSTVLYSTPSSIDFATRMAKLLARRLKTPCYVGSSVNLASAVEGGSVDEEMEAFRAIVDIVCKQAHR